MSQKTQMIQMLTDAGAAGVTSREFNDAQIFRYSARIEELRKAGHEISTERVKGTLFRFILRANNSSSLEGPGEAYGNALQEPEQAAGELTTSAAYPLPSDSSGEVGMNNHDTLGDCSTVAYSSVAATCGQAGGDGRAHKVESVEPLNVVESPVTSSRSCLNPYEYEAEVA